MLPRGRGGRGALRARDHRPPRAAGLPPARRPRGRRPPAGPLPRGPGRARLRRGDRAGPRGPAVDAAVPDAGRAAARRHPGRRDLPAERPRAGDPAVVLPVEERPRRRAARPRGAGRAQRARHPGRAGAPDARRPAGRTVHGRLRGPVAADAQHLLAGPRRRPLRRVRRFAPQGDGPRDAVVLPEPGAGRPPPAGPAAGRLHVPERAARAPLRRRRPLRHPLPEARVAGRPPARAARAREPADRHLLREPDVGGAAGPVGAGDAARGAPAAPAAQRAAAARERPRPADVAARAHGAAPRQPRLLELPRPHGPAGLRDGALRRGRTLARERRRGRDQRDHRVERRHRRQPPRVPRRAAGDGARLRAHGRGEDDDLRPGPRPRLLRRPDPAAHRAGPGARRLPLVVAGPRRRLERATSS